MSLFREYHTATPNAPLIVSAPMRLISTAPLACAVSLAGGLGFLGAGTDASTLSQMLRKCGETLYSATFKTGYKLKRGLDFLPVGVGFLLWGISDDTLNDEIVPVLRSHKPVAVWLFAPRGDLSGTPAERQEHLGQLRQWVDAVRGAVPGTEIWLQVGSVMEVRAALEDELIWREIDVLVVQGADAGGHGLVQGAGLITLLPEIGDVVRETCTGRSKRPNIVAAGGLSTGSQVAAMTLLGAEGAVLGTRFLASEEASLAKGYRAEVVRASDGGQSTVRSGVYDYLRGTREWPRGYGGRGVVNTTYQDWMKKELGPGSGTGVHGLAKASAAPEIQKKRDELAKSYKEAESRASGEGEGVWGPKGRMTTYAGTGVGLIKKIMPAGDIVSEIQEECMRLLGDVKSTAG